MEIVKYVLLGVLALIIIIFSIITIKNMVRDRKRKAEEKSRMVDDVKVEDGIRYTVDKTIVNEDGEMNISYDRKDIMLLPRKVMIVGKKNEIKPGKYTVLSAYANEETFNIRIGLYVKEYTHGQEIILAEGEEICPTSTTIILR